MLQRFVPWKKRSKPEQSVSLSVFQPHCQVGFRALRFSSILMTVNSTNCKGMLLFALRSKDTDTQHDIVLKSLMMSYSNWIWRYLRFSKKQNKPLATIHCLIRRFRCNRCRKWRSESAIQQAISDERKHETSQLLVAWACRQNNWSTTMSYARATNY